MCRVYAVTRAGYYAWKQRAPSRRTQADTDLQQRIAQVHRDSRGTYGSPRVHRVLRANGHCVGENRVARIMRASGIRARVATLRYTCPNLRTTTRSSPTVSSTWRSATRTKSGSVTSPT